METTESITLNFRNFGVVEHFVAFKVHWLPKDTHIGYLSYIVRGKTSEDLDRMEKMVYNAFDRMTFDLKEVKRERLVFVEQLQYLQELTSGASTHKVLLQFFHMPDLSKSRISNPVQTTPLVFHLNHWIPLGDERMKYMPQRMLVEVPEDFGSWEEQVKKITPL